MKVAPSLHPLFLFPKVLSPSSSLPPFATAAPSAMREPTGRNKNNPAKCGQPSFSSLHSSLIEIPLPFPSFFFFFFFSFPDGRRALAGWRGKSQSWPDSSGCAAAASCVLIFSFLLLSPLPFFSFSFPSFSSVRLKKCGSGE